VDVNGAYLTEKCPSGTCVALAGVYCEAPECQYSLFIAQNSVVTIAQGLPTQGTVEAGQYVYFKFYNRKEQVDLAITLTMLSSGEVDLCIGKGSKTLPMHGTCKWTGKSGVNIMADDPKVDGNMKGTFIIGVYGIEQASFSITLNEMQ
jgi:hypothetical protein